MYIKLGEAVTKFGERGDYKNYTIRIESEPDVPMITKMIDSNGDAVLKIGPFSEDFPNDFLSVHLTVWEDQSDFTNHFEIKFSVFVNAKSDFKDFFDELYKMEEEDERDHDEHFEDDKDRSKEEFHDDDDHDDDHDEFHDEFENIK